MTDDNEIARQMREDNAALKQRVAALEQENHCLNCMVAALHVLMCQVWDLLGQPFNP